MEGDTCSLPEFVQILGVLGGNDDNKRSQAETLLAKINPILKLSLYLQAVSLPDVDLSSRTLAAVLCRRTIQNDFDESFKPLGPIESQQMKNQLIQIMSLEQLPQIRQKIIEIVSAIAEKEIEQRFEQIYNSPIESAPPICWPDLLQFIVNNGTSSNCPPHLLECSLSLINMVPSIFATDNQSSVNIESLRIMGGIVMRGFNLTDLKMKLLAAKCLRSILDTFSETPGINESLKELTPFLLQTVNEHCKEDDEQALTVLVDICDESAKFLRPHLLPALELCFSVLNNPQLEETVRHLSLECVISLAENLSAAVRKQAGRFVQPLCETLLRMMSELDDDCTAWSLGNDQDEDEDDSEMSAAITGETSLDRLACALGGKVVLDVITRVVPGWLKSDNWKQRHAGLMAISACGEGCHKQMQAMLKSIVDSVVPLLGDVHPRVRYAACNALGQMCTDFAADLQKNYHSKIVAGLVTVLDDNENPRVQSHAAAALVNFCESCPKHILSQYLDLLVCKLHAVLTARFQELHVSSKRMVLEQTVITVAALADAVEEQFQPYYDRFVPGLKSIIEHAVQPDLRMLRGKTIECITLIALAVGKQQFLPDSHQIIQLLLAAQTEQQEDDDPQVTYMIAAWARICRLLGADFQPFLPAVMTPLMKVAASEPECSIVDNEDQSQQCGEDWTLVKLKDNQNFAINTSAIEDKATACNLLVCYAKEIKAGFLPYVSEVAALMIKLCFFYFNDPIRSSAAEIFPHLLEIYGEADVGMQADLWSRIKSTLVNVIECEPEREVLGDFLLSLANCVKVMGDSSLSVEDLQSLAGLVQTQFNVHFEKHEQRLALRLGEDYDEEEEQRLLSEKDEDEYVLNKLSDLLQALFKVHGANILGFWETCVLSNVTRLLEPSRPWSDLHWGVNFYLTVLENVPADHEASERYRCTVQELLSKCVRHQEPDVQQIGCYGVGLAACSANQNYLNWLSEMVPVLIQLVENTLQHRSARTLSVLGLDEEVGGMFENAVSALCKIMQHRPMALQPHGLSVDLLLPRWIQWLPLRWDEEEVVPVYQFVCSLLANNNAVLMSNPGLYLPHVVHCFVVSITNDVLHSKQPVYHDALNLIRHIQENSELFQLCLNKLSNEEKNTLDKCLRS